MKVFVTHAYQGCDSGCCGHLVTLEDDDGNEVKHHFQITHPDNGDDFKKWACELIEEEFGAEHVADLDWEQCVITTD